MSTAIIVSGILRNLINASSSWEISGDYYLLIDKDIMASQSQEVTGSSASVLQHALNNCSVDFVSANIILDNKLSHPMLTRHSTLNMAWKWKCAYNYIKPYHDMMGYTGIFILRPDIYLRYKSPLITLKDISVKDNNISASSKITQLDGVGKPMAQDICLYMNMQTFGVLSLFYDYYKEAICHGTDFELHRTLAKFLIEHNITVDDKINNVLDFTVLRGNAEHMFENGKLKSEYTIVDLARKQYQWDSHWFQRNNILKMENKNMKKSIIICGDSFNVGIGCRDLTTEPYGVLLGNELNKPVINLAKGSSTNLSIYLQAKYAVDKLIDKTDLVLVSNTSYDRVAWFPIDHTHQTHDITNANVNYHQYPPYGPHSYHQILESPMKDDVQYDGAMYTENYRGIIDYWENFGSKNKESGYYARFKNEPKERMKLLYDFAASIHDTKLDRIQCMGVLTMAHMLLKRAGINHLMLVDDIQEYSKFIDPVNLVYVSWGQLSLDYPDDLPSMHTSRVGHCVVFDAVLAKLTENNWV